MKLPHRHNDVEVNFVAEGELEYQFGGRPFCLREGEIAVFWAALPHRLLPSSSGRAFWIHMPLNSVLSWPLSRSEVSSLLSFHPLVASAGDLPYDAAKLFEQWRLELIEPPRAPIAEVEAQGMIRRILRGRPGRAAREGLSALETTGRKDTEEGEELTRGSMAHVGALSRYIAENYHCDLSVSDIADAQGLSASYAMALFKSVTGMTLGKYLSWCRISEAQRLLATTDLPVSDIIVESGFTSPSSFYAQFAVECGVSPREYRRISSAG